MGAAGFGRYLVGYATRDGNTHDHSAWDTLAEAQAALDALRERWGVQRPLHFAGFIWDNDNPERGSLDGRDPEEEV